MTRKITKAGFLLSVFLLTSCATVHPYKHVQSEGDATAIVYRANKFVGGGIVGVVKVDGLAVAKFGVKKYVAIPLTPGPHVIGIHGESHGGNDYNVELNVAPQEKVYFEVGVNPKHWAWLAVPFVAAFNQPLMLTKRSLAEFANQPGELEVVKMSYAGVAPADTNSQLVEKSSN